MRSALHWSRFHQQRATGRYTQGIAFHQRPLCHQARLTAGEPGHPLVQHEQKRFSKSVRTEPLRLSEDKWQSGNACVR